MSLLDDLAKRFLAWAESQKKPADPVAEVKAPAPVVTEPPPAPVVPPKTAITRDRLVDVFLSYTKTFIDMPVRETEGHNRSSIIDRWNQRVGAPLGTSYCASSQWCNWKTVCDSLGLKFPMHATASSQYFATGTPSKYIRPEGSLGKRGDAAVLTLVNDSGHGHVVCLRADQVSQPNFDTYEFNTNLAGSRDGDGGYAKTRSTVDKSSENAGKLFKCFVDIPQWIIDTNSGATVSIPVVTKPLPVEAGDTEHLAVPGIKNEWAAHMLKVLDDSVLAQLNKGGDDIKRFFPKYPSMTLNQRRLAWIYLFSGVINFESGYDPKSGMTESNGDVSLGLFQLSYGNMFCPKSKAEGDLTDPKINLTAGIKIFAHFVAQDGVVCAGGYERYGASKPLGAARYWSVLRTPDSKSKHHLSEIISIAKQAPGAV